MTFREAQAPLRQIWPAVAAGLALFLAGASSIAGINIFGIHFGFAFLPLLVIMVWPRRAVAPLSVLLVFLAGLFTDWATGGVPGQWALVLSLGWGFLRPEMRSYPFMPMRLLFFWLVLCGLAMALLTISGWFIYRTPPDLTVLGRNMLIATLMLPLVAGLRHVLAKRFGDGEDWD